MGSLGIPENGVPGFTTRKPPTGALGRTSARLKGTAGVCRIEKWYLAGLMRRSFGFDSQSCYFANPRHRKKAPHAPQTLYYAEPAPGL